jgi:uncharacterized protein (TIGR00251 family)
MASSALRLQVLVQPRARGSRIVGRYADGIKVQVSAPPVDGAANEAVIALLAAALDVPRRNIRIVQGGAARRKLVEVLGAEGACRKRLEALLQAVDKAEPRR